MIILRVADVVYLTRGDAVLILNNFNERFYSIVNVVNERLFVPPSTSFRFSPAGYYRETAL